MAVGKTDYTKFKARVFAERKRKEDREGLWKPNPGRYFGRIAPPCNSDCWELAYFAHYNILKNAGKDEPTWLICLKSLDLACYACEMVQSMWDEWRAMEGDSPEKLKLKKEASNIGSKDRYVVNFVNVKEPAKVYRWDYGRKVHQQLGEIMAPVGEDGVELPIVEIDNPDRGYTLSILVEKARGDDGREWNQMTVALPNGAQPKPLPDKTVLTKLNDLGEWLKKHTKSYDEMRALLSGAGDVTEETIPPEGEEIAAAEAEAAVESIPEDAPPEVIEETEPEPTPPPPKAVAKVAAKPPTAADATAKARTGIDAMKAKFTAAKK